MKISINWSIWLNLLINSHYCYYCCYSLCSSNITWWTPLAECPWEDWVQAWCDGIRNQCLHGRAPSYLADHLTSSQPLMLLLTVFVYDPLTWIVSLFLAADLARTAVGLFITLPRLSGSRCQMNLEIRTALVVLNDSESNSLQPLLHSVASALDVY